MTSTSSAIETQSNPDPSLARLPRRTTKDRSQFLGVLRKHVVRLGIKLDSKVLVIGGMPEDAEVLQQCGFRNVTLSNIEGRLPLGADIGKLPIRAIDAEDIALPDNSYDILVVHEVIHHCRSPHRALCEMLRVARGHVIMMEPSDSAFMRLLIKAGFSFPFEIFAVVDNNYVCGGVRNSSIPNFIYRWSGHDVYKTAASFMPDSMFESYPYPYWDFALEERDLAYRKQTRIESLTRLIGAKNFIRLLRKAQTVLNRVPILRRQGNKFFCCIKKTEQLQPWLLRDESGQVSFRRGFQARLD
jgi:SAM-dependent methyltransferase